MGGRRCRYGGWISGGDTNYVDQGLQVLLFDESWLSSSMTAVELILDTTVV